MISTLKPGQKLMYAGMTALRSPSGTLLPAVPQYIIVSAGKADPAAIADLKENECLILAGAIHNERANAEERFAALQEGHKQPQRAKGTELYIKECARNVNPKTRLSAEEEKACDPIINDLLAAFSADMQKTKKLLRSGRAIKNEKTL